MQSLYEETKFLMRKYNISANKSLGQNFLIDDDVVNNIVYGGFSIWHMNPNIIFEY